MKASERAYQGLLQEIVDGVLSPGTILAEVEQASRLGISRTPLREALYKLHADGFLTTPTGRGANVTGISLDRAKELYEVRRALEETAAAIAAETREDGVFDRLASEFGVAANTLSLDETMVREYYDLNARFDAAIDIAVNNDYLVSALETVRKHATRLRRVAQSDLSRLVASAWETQLICEAIEAKDPVLAAHATHVHLHKSLRHVLTTFD
jgi:DNA-binding GntR family transcriptional regulator